MRRNQRTDGEARRRTGCWPCKNKHVRCSEEQPACARCTRLGIRCEYGIRLLWQEDAAQRGICLGREGAWSKHSKPKSKRPTPTHYFIVPTKAPIFLHTTHRHFEGHVETSEDEEDEGSITHAEVVAYPYSPLDLPKPNAALSPLSALPNNEAYLLDYFISAICPNCSLSPTDNPYLCYIAPMTFSYPPLHHAVISIAATERQQLLNDRRFETEAWWYKSQSLKGLQATISSGTVNWPFIATILMLCFGDIAGGCNNSWRVHLQGGLSLINEIQADCTESQMLRKFCLMYFVAHEIMGATAGDSSFHSTPYTWLEDDNIEEIDPLMGCSRGLLDIINRISAISSDFSRTRSSELLTVDEIQSLNQNRSDLERALHTIRQYPSSIDTNPNIALVAEAKRTTALLYLHERFNSILPMSRAPDAFEAMPRYINRLADSLLLQLEPLPNTPTLLWPLFVLGNASPHNEEHRRFVLERLDGILKGRNLGSVRLARRLVECEYRDWDLHAHELNGQNLTGANVVGRRTSRGPREKWISLA